MVNAEHLRADYIERQIASRISHIKVSSFIPFSSTNIFQFVEIIFGVLILLLVLRRILAIKHLLKEKYVLLELTPPATTEKSAFTTQQLFSVIHNLGSKSFTDKLLGRKNIFSFEIVSTLNRGIRYLVRATPEQATNIQRNVLSYIPHVKVNQVDEYLTNNLEGFQTKIVEFKLKKYFAYPLQKQDILEEHDPVAYITGNMTKLKAHELVSFQIVLSPNFTAETRVIKSKIIKGEDIFAYLNRFKLPPVFLVIELPLKLLFKLLESALSVVTTFFNDFNNVKTPIKNSSYKKERIYNSFEKEVIQGIEEKIDQPLFEAKIRVLVAVKSKSELKERIKGFSSSLAVFSVPSYQAIGKKLNIGIQKLLLFNFQKRLLSLFSNSSPFLLSASEIADLYHFPFTTITRTENIVKAYSKQLPAPLSLKGEKELDVSFGKNMYGGTETLIGLSEEEREKHMYIIGATGSGKTTMITSMVSEDIKNGKGVAVIDPHGDLAETLITCIPNERIDDLIYVNPDDLKYPIGINLLELTPGLDEDDLLREKEFITESVISLFRKVFSESMAGHAHRIEYILRNTIQTALTLENPTLFTIYELLNNPPFQKQATRNLEDENLKNFWKYEYGKAGDYQKVKMISPVAARIGRFLFSPSAKRMLEQQKSTINFDEILDKRKILICNLAKGKLGEDTSEVLGIMIVAKLQLAALRRARMSEKKRKPFYLYVDEFQNFATASFIQMLSEARKYKTFLVMAEQSTSQQKDKNLVNVILANVGTVVSFRSANPEDEKLMLPQFSPFIEKGDISNLPRYNFYIKISAINPEEAFSGTTTPVDISFNKARVEELIQASRVKNGIVYKKVKKDTNQEIADSKEEINNRQGSVSSEGLPAIVRV